MNEAILSITFCAPGQLRMRKVVKRSNARHTAKFPSVKAGRILQAESEGELSVFRMAECDFRFARFEDQPCEIIWWDGEQERSHIPDLRVFLTDGAKELWEIKRRAGITPDVEKLTAFLEVALPRHGYRYRLVEAEEAETKPARRNRALVTHFGYRPVDLREREIVRVLLEKNGSISWGEAFDGICGRFGREILCRLIIEGELTFDLNRELMLDTRFYLRDGGI